jgi:hypothetical protein
MDAVRCLKRFVAREVYNSLKLDLLQNRHLTFIGPSIKETLSSERIRASRGSRPRSAP